MKITVSSPDGLGDFILRLPMLAALREAGHELQIFLRPPAFDLAQVALPDCRLIKIAQDPYAGQIRARGFPFRPEHRAISAFGPDLYLATAFNLSFFDQVWVEQNRGRVKTAGFTCAHGTRNCPTTCDPERVAAGFGLSVPVDPFLPEGEKNRRLLEAVLGRSIALAAPRLQARDADYAAARALLQKQGWEGEEFWIACVGHRPGIAGKDWGEENWAGFFADAFAGKTVVFLGNSKESESISRIIRAASRGSRFLNLASAPPALPVSLALAGLSAGYVGRDSGVMHLTCAVEKPVLALFSGAHGRRFWPSATSGIVVVQDWPCRECEFCCAHDGDHCVKGVPQDTVREAWNELRTSPPQGLRVVEIPLPAERALDLAREASRKYARLAGELAQWKANEQRTVNWLDAFGRRLRQFSRRRFL